MAAAAAARAGRAGQGRVEVGVDGLGYLAGSWGSEQAVGTSLVLDRTANGGFRALIAGLARTAALVGISENGGVPRSSGPGYR